MMLDFSLGFVPSAASVDHTAPGRDATNYFSKKHELTIS